MRQYHLLLSRFSKKAAVRIDRNNGIQVTIHEIVAVIEKSG